MTNQLIRELDRIQQDYLKILKRIVLKPDNMLLKETIDEINIFWFKNRNIINLAGKYLFVEKDTYCFTGVSIYGVEDQSQNSFFLLGEYHVFDDPIPWYANTINDIEKISDSLYYEGLRSIVTKTISDNIKLMENYNGFIWVMPLKFISEINDQFNKNLEDIAERLFCQLFNGVSNLREYHSIIKTASDIEQYIDQAKVSSIILYDDDIFSKSWDERLTKYKSENVGNMPSDCDDGTAFFYSVYGHLRQALGIVDVASRFEVIPVLRSKRTFTYFLFIWDVIELN